MKPDLEEKNRLADCLGRIDDNLRVIATRLLDYGADIRETTSYMWEARRDLDHIDKVAMRQAIEQKSRSAEFLQQQRNKLGKMRTSPYFGRFDFARTDDGAGAARPVYVGVHDFRDDNSGDTIVYDWRAPVSSMFYDYEIGAASYEAPSGRVSGRVDLKRQFRICDGRLEFMIESGVHIVDDVLQEELSRSADEGMKNIVATIQRDQNAIIRNSDSHTLIIQGVAGSGKTSIALHRIAFLLYRFKDSLTSDDILIISPNRVFADYIGNVLPELGEEQVREIGMEALADGLLQGKFPFETFADQTARLLEKHDPALRERITTKASTAFLAKIDAYVDHIETSTFQASEWRSGRIIVPDWHFREAWRKYPRLPVSKRVSEVVALTDHKVYMHYKRELQKQERQALSKAVRAMVRPMTLRTAYKGLYEWLGQPELFKPLRGKLEYADVFPMMYLKMRLEGIENPHTDVKHLLVDEMQDYTPVQYAVLGALFPCRKTILGDATQSVNPYGASTADDIRQILRAPSAVKLTRSYRSTWEIMQFALAISPNDELIAMKRHGPEPTVTSFKQQADILNAMGEQLEEFQKSDHNSLAIIAKTQKQADLIHSLLTEAGHEVRLLRADSAGFSTCALVCTAHLAKGLEFDRVIVADASAASYQTEMDRNLLYVACTRAMHQLAVFTLGEPSLFLKPRGPT